jgi:iron complex outermembrane receptor protein
MQKLKWFTLSTVIASTVLTSQAVSAQALEEIVVTAQRREQSLQEVPISLEAYSGDDLISGGLRTIQDVELFSPSVEITTQVRQTSTVIRGMGSSGGNYSIDPAAPIFQDGIHFGRASMISGAFLDVERLEILRGPQPIHFGQNATAGAFSVITRRPTPEWEGDVTMEIGNFGRKSIEGGAGGPITDTFGIRLAGTWDESTGHLTDVVTVRNIPTERIWAHALRWPGSRPRRSMPSSRPNI